MLNGKTSSDPQTNTTRSSHVPVPTSRQMWVCWVPLVVGSFYLVTWRLNFFSLCTLLLSVSGHRRLHATPATACLHSPLLEPCLKSAWHYLRHWNWNEPTCFSFGGIFIWLSNIAIAVLASWWHLMYCSSAVRIAQYSILSTNCDTNAISKGSLQNIGIALLEYVSSSAKWALFTS